MYLTLLSSKQKELFIEIAIEIATADGIFKDEEKAIIGAYCKEMDISYYYEKKHRDVMGLLEELNSISNDKEKRIIAFELMGVCLADGLFHKEEKNLMDKIKKIFEINPEFINSCEAIINEYKTLQDRINSLVL